MKNILFAIVILLFVSCADQTRITELEDEIEELEYKIEEQNETIEELQEKLDNISSEVSYAKSNLEDALFFKLPGALDDLETNLEEIESECYY